MAAVSALRSSSGRDSCSFCNMVSDSIGVQQEEIHCIGDRATVALPIWVMLGIEDQGGW